MDGRADPRQAASQDGDAEMQRQIASNFKKAGIPLHIIAQNTGLPEEEIQKL